MEQYASIQQLKKKEPGAEERKNIYPPTPVQAVFDAKTGASLEALLAQYNSIYVQYQGTPYDTRCIIPDIMRRQGLIISYVDMEGVTIEEQCINATQRDNEHWGKDENWLNLSELHDKAIQTAYVSLERIIEAANAFMDKLNQGVSPDMLSESVKQLLAEAGATVTNLPDEEDITTTGGTIPTLKFKDKEYLPEMSSGLGRKILRKNMVTGNRHTATLRVTAPVALDGTITVILDGNPHTVPVTAEAHNTIELVAQAIASVANDHYNVSAQDEYVTFVSKTIGEASATTIDNGSTGTSFIINDTAVEDTINLLSQDMVQKANTIYIVQYDYDLNGETLTIPEGCTLDFQGGSFSNGKIVGNRTEIKSNTDNIFNINIALNGSFKNKWILEWFKNEGNNDSIFINEVIKIITNIEQEAVLVFTKSEYNILNTIELNVAYLSYDINSIFYCENLEDEIAITIPSIGGIVIDSYDVASAKFIDGLNLIGNSITATTKTAISLGYHHISFRSLQITYFKKGLSFNSNSYLLSFYNIAIGRCENCIFLEDGTNMGENYSFFGGGFANSTNCIYGKDNNLTMHFYGVSFDYSTRFIKTTHGNSRISFIGCHLESFNDNRMSTYEEGDGPIVIKANNETKIAFIDCEFLSYNKFTPSWSGIDYFIYKTSNQGFIFLERCRLYNIGTKSLVGGGSGVKVTNTIRIQNESVVPYAISDYENALVNNGIDLNYYECDENGTITLEDNQIVYNKVGSGSAFFYMIFPISNKNSYFSFIMEISSTKTIYATPSFAFINPRNNSITLLDRAFTDITIYGSYTAKFDSTHIPQNCNAVVIKFNTGTNIPPLVVNIKSCNVGLW